MPEQYYHIHCFMQQEGFWNYIMKYGLVLGLSQVILTLFAYILGIEYMTSYWLSGIVLILIISVVIYSGIQWRKLNGGHLSFGNAFFVMFFVYAAAGIITLLFNFVLYNVINPDLASSMQEAIIDKTMESMERWNAPEEAVEETMMRLQNMEENFSITSMTIGYFWSLIMGAVLSLIVSIFVKKKEVQ